MKWQRIAQAAVLLGASTLIGGCFGIEFSPDGKWIAFVWPDSEKLGIMPTEGGKVRWVQSAKSAMWPRWSPDGRTILAACDRDMLLIDVEHDRSVIIPGSAGYAVWSPKGDRFAVAGETQVRWFRMGNKTADFTLNLPAGLAPWSPFMAWVPETDAVLFLGASRKDAKNGKDGGDIYMAEQGELTKLTTMRNAIGMCLSLDGKSVRWCTATPSGRAILLSIYEMNLRVRSATRLKVVELAPSEAGLAPRATQKAGFALFAPDAESLLLATEQESMSEKDSLYTYIGSNGVVKVVDRTHSLTGFVLPAFHPSGNAVALQKAQDKASIEWFDLTSSVHRTLFK